MSIFYLISVVFLSTVVSSQFTGDIWRDFGGDRKDTVYFFDDLPALSVRDCTTQDDPIQLRSGWAPGITYFKYSKADDSLQIGIVCVGVCGDADGDGNPDTTGQRLSAIGGVDQVDLSGEESIFVLLDFSNSAAAELGRATTGEEKISWQYVLGVPPASADACSDESATLTSCFGLYRYAEHASTLPFTQRFGARTTLVTTDNHHSPSFRYPNLEWIIHDVSKLDARVRASIESTQTVQFQAQLYLGSQDDAIIGSYLLPASNTTWKVAIPVVDDLSRTTTPAAPFDTNATKK